MSIVNRSMFQLQTSMSLVTKMQKQFDKLQTQLGTGQRAANLAEMGDQRLFDLSVRSRLNRIEGYSNNIDIVNMRLNVLDNVLTRLETVEADSRQAIQTSTYGAGNLNFGTAPSLAKARLEEVVVLLNSDVDGRYLFAGGNAEKVPVENLDAIMDGIDGKAGFRQIVAERLAADVGAGLGRLTLTMPATDTVLLAEDGNHPFGLKLANVSASNLATVTPTYTAGPPASANVQFTGVPAVDDTISVSFTLPDGTSQTVTLRATTNDPPGEGQFLIGADADETATNFRDALNASLTQVATTELVTASNFAAADNFFNGAGNEVMRVAGPPFDTATALVQADATDTVFWYRGSNVTNARETVSSRIDDTAIVNYGVQANESGTVQLVRTLAVLAIQNFTNADPTSTGRFDAVAERNDERLSEAHNYEAGSIEMVAVDLGSTRANVGNLSERQINYTAQLEGILSDIETVPDEEVAMQMMALQTRLTASYQATALISKLSLVNYM